VSILIPSAIPEFFKVLLEAEILDGTFIGFLDELLGQVGLDKIVPHRILEALANLEANINLVTEYPDGHLVTTE
jgi:hypothetical protein